MKTTEILALDDFPLMAHSLFPPSLIEALRSDEVLLDEAESEGSQKAVLNRKHP